MKTAIAILAVSMLAAGCGADKLDDEASRLLLECQGRFETTIKINPLFGSAEFKCTDSPKKWAGGEIK